MVELLIVVTVLGILTAIAAPYMGDMVRTQRLRTASFDVFASLMFARSEAVKRDVSVTLAPSGGSWLNGWTVTDASGTVLKTQSAAQGLSITGPGNVIYTGTGRLSTAVTPFSLSVTQHTGTTLSRCVTVDLSGRPVSKEAAC
jgi:type IV fimbrial biogenesis protein FimT